MIYDLPTSVEINETTYEIRSDYRAILDILIALSDPELDSQSKAFVALKIFYPDFESIPQNQIEQAIKECFLFINGGEEDEGPKAPHLVSWEQDFQYIIAPINRVIGQEIRSVEYLHWYSFLSAYMEIGGDCTFAQIVSLRDKMARHKKLEKHEKEWYQRNKKLVDFRRKYTEADENLLKQWI